MAQDAQRYFYPLDGTSGRTNGSTSGRNEATGQPAAIDPLGPLTAVKEQEDDTMCDDVVDVGVESVVDVRMGIENPLACPHDTARPQRSIGRRPRAEFIRDVRRLIVASWLAKTGQQWRWTAYDRECLYRLTMATSAGEVMAAWDCYLKIPWKQVAIPHFTSETLQTRLRDDPKFKSLAAMYFDRLNCKRGMKRRFP